MNLKITKTELAKLILVAFPLGCSIFLLASFIVTYSSLQSASSEQAQIILLLYSSATVPILSVYLLCLSAYLLWKHTQQVQALKKELQTNESQKSSNGENKQ